MLEKLPEPLCTAVISIFQQVEILRKRYPGKRFTPGDKLMGDTGEVLAESLFDILPLPGNPKDHDCRCAVTAIRVQVKTTGGNRLGLGLKKTAFEHLLAFKVYPDGTYEVLYNGLGSRVAKHIEKNSSPSIQVAALRELNKQVGTGEALPRRKI